MNCNTNTTTLLNAKDDNGATPLMYAAASNGDCKAVKYIIAELDKCGINSATIKDNANYTALDYAKLCNNEVTYGCLSEEFRAESVAIGECPMSDLFFD